jgi:hypothetical protein
MPDQYDPKQTLRSPYGRPAEPRPAPAPQNDPLAELARMVHGRAPQTSQPLTRAAAEPAAPADLESELLNDLQASFAAVREAAAQVTARRPEPAAAAPAATPRVPPPVAAPPPPLSLPEPPRGRAAAPEPELTYPSIFAPRTQPPVRGDERADAHPEIRPEFRLEPLDESRLVPIPPAPVIQPQVPPGYAERQAERAAAAAAAAVEPLPRVIERGQRQTLPVEPEAEEEDFSTFQLRPSTPAAALPPAPSAPSTPSRWEKPQPAETAPPAVSRFAPPPAPVAEEAFEDEASDPFADAGLFPVQEASDDEFDADEFGLAPEYADDEDDVPADLDETQPARRRVQAGPPRGMMIAAAVVAIALVGGISVAMFRSGQNSAGAPPTILADNAPTKITPEDSDAQPSNDADAQNKIIYDRVNSAEANGNTTLLTPDNTPLRTAPAPDSGNAISRVILPGGPGYDSPNASGSSPATGATAAATASSSDDDDSLGPRKVRTVVVKPDGTILSSSATDAPAADDSAQAAAPAAATAVTPAPAPQPAAPAPAAPITDDTAAIAGTGGNALAITTNPDAANAPAIPPAPAPATTAAPTPAPAAVQPKPAKIAPPTAVASADPNGPIDLTPGNGAAAALPAAAADGFYVQVSSQRTEDAARATYKDLQSRYPTILGKYDVNLQQADVPSRGTFYRVRVGPFASADAQRLCDDLKSAGGDCVLARR